MSEPQEIPVWEKLDFRHDAIIEASAGTGKTYALEHIVERLVNNGVDIRKLLLVTFTEKAAGELKERIRAILTESQTRTGAAITAAKRLDEATICTIHSFCQGLLREYPFESGMQMATEVVSSDRALMEKAVQSVMTGVDFQKKYGADFAQLMQAWKKDKDAQGLRSAVVTQLAKLIASNKPPESINLPGVLRETVVLAYNEYTRIKKRERVITFDDMVLETSRMVADAVKDTRNLAKQAFLKTIRQRYRVALVDEFQDTDDKQWTIFKLLFSSGVNVVDGATPEQGCLIVVGDPKQAIYSFRGADIATYLRARKEIEDAGGQRFRLDKMFRSTKEMVDAFNAIFKADDWFTDMSVNGLSILYTDTDGAVKFPMEDAPLALRNFKYPDDEAAVELLESLPEDEVRGTKSCCLPLYLENMTAEMKRLHESEFWMHRERQKDRMEWSAMCVLVKSHADGDVVQKALRTKGIPCRKYKEAGLFASVESESVLALFDYLSMPRNTGNISALLLTPFFEVQLSKIEGRLQFGDIRFDDLCERWRGYISKCEWVKFFESVMNDSELGKPHVGDADFVRHRSGVRQIFDRLLTHFGKARELATFSDALRSWKHDDSELAEAGSVRDKESEADAVQIMTMHAAKGLEFNAVFVASGFTGVSRNTPAEEKPVQKAELRRLLYVALTRARFKLYLPWSRHAAEDGIASVEAPLGAFLSNGIRALYGQGANDKVRGTSVLQTCDSHKMVVANSCDSDNELYPDLPPRLGMKGWRFKWDSFSSLNHHSAKKVEEVDGAKPKEDENQNATDDQNQNEEQKKSLVPKGALSGTVFHEVMEKLCEASDGIGFEIGQKSEVEFKELINETDDKKSPLLELVRRRLSANGVANKKKDEDGETTASVIARMAWNALRTELHFGDENKFKLCDIPLEDCRGTCRKAEVNFVLDESNLGGVREEGAGALNGSIDLLVRRDDGYYIVDWKTNALDDYKDATVATAMDEAGYHLQYKIYTLAAEKWLGEKTVKGVAYLFVRGGETGTNASGKFVHPIKEVDREEFAKAFRVRIDASDKAEADKEKEEL